jgi:hypothetical protein
MTLAQLRTMALDMKVWASSWESTRGKPFSSVTLYHFSSEYQKYGKPDEMTISFSEEMSTSLGYGGAQHEPEQPEYLISVSYHQPVEDMMASIEWHAEARALPDSTVYWAWFFAYSPGDVRDWDWSHGSPTEPILDYIDGVALLTCVTKDGLLSPFGRANPCEEIFAVWERQLLVDVCCTTGVRATMRPFGNRSYEFGTFDPILAEAMLAYDVRKIDRAVGAGGADRVQKVLDQIDQNMDGGLDAFNLNVHVLASGPLVLQACLDGDVKKVLQILQKSHIDFSSPRLRGLQGETPLMVAASCGHESVLSFLLKRKCDIGAEDIDGENALHYAAAACQPEAVRILLAAGTKEADNQSFDEKTPLDLALQNPAFFMDKNADAVAEVLQLEKHFRDVLSKRAVGADMPSEELHDDLASLVD